MSESTMRFPIAPTDAYGRPPRRATTSASSRRSCTSSHPAVGGRRRGLAAARFHRWSAVLEHRRRRAIVAPRFPVNRSGEGVAGVDGVRSLDELDVARRAHRHLRAPQRCARRRPRRRSRSARRALCVISAGFAEVGSRGRRAPGAIARARAGRTVGGSSGRTASASRFRARPQCDVRAGVLSRRPGRLRVAERCARPRRCSKQARSAPARLLRRSCRSGTRRTSRRTTCSSTGRTTRRRGSWLLYLESFGNPAVRRESHVALRATSQSWRSRAASSRAGASAASSHTAALAGSEAAVEALFHQAGVQRMRQRWRSCWTPRVCSRRSRHPQVRAWPCSPMRVASGSCAPMPARPRLQLPELAAGDPCTSSRTGLPAEASLSQSGRHAGVGDGRDLRRVHSGRCSPIRGRLDLRALRAAAIAVPRTSRGAVSTRWPRAGDHGKAVLGVFHERRASSPSRIRRMPVGHVLATPRRPRVRSGAPPARRLAAPAGGAASRHSRASIERLREPLPRPRWPLPTTHGSMRSPAAGYSRRTASGSSARRSPPTRSRGRRRDRARLPGRDQDRGAGCAQDRDRRRCARPARCRRRAGGGSAHRRRRCSCSR